MRNNEHPAVAAFKSRADRAAEALANFGYQVKRTHLMDVLSRVDGERNWKEYKAKLSKTTSETPQRTAYEAPDLKGKVVHFLVNGYNNREEELFGYIKVDQKTICYMAALMAEQLLAISTEGASATMEGSLPVFWFNSSGMCHDTARIDITGFEMALTTQADMGRLGDATSQNIDVAEMFDAIELAVQSGTGHVMYVDDDDSAMDELAKCLRHEELKPWRDFV